MEALLVSSRRITSLVSDYHFRARLNGVIRSSHTHFVAHTYHMDINPGNFLLDADSSLVLIDGQVRGQLKAHRPLHRSA